MRTEKLDARIGERCDTVLITSFGDAPDMNLQYYSGLDATQGSGVVFWKVGRSPTLVTRDIKQKHSAHLVQRRDKDTVYKELKALRPKKLGINADYVPVSMAARIRKKTGARLVDISKELTQVRAIKEKKELACISQACFESRKALRGLETLGRRETDVYTDIVDYYAKEGLALAFDPIVASGKNTTLIHTRPSARRIDRDDTVIIDTGCRVGGYCSDITVTKCAEPDGQTRETLSRIEDAYKLAAREARPGMKARELCGLVKDSFGKRADYWAYGLGHGVGLDIHEFPNLSLESNDVLREGLVFTLEPGLVGPGQGARTEFTGVLTAKGFKPL